MRLSIIVPCYNCETTVERCIRSILNQSFTDFEIIAVNDGATDGTGNKLEQLCREDARVLVINQNNSGPSAARNKGLKESTGEYITFVDSDDFLQEDAYDVLITLAKERQAQIVICDYAEVHSNGQIIERHHVLPEKLEGKMEIQNYLLRQFYGGNMTGLPALWNKIYERSFLEGLSFDESLYRGEDWWFNMVAFEKAERIATTHDVLYYYWQGNPNSLMRRLDSKYYKDWTEARKYLTEKNREYGFEYNEDEVYAQLLRNIHSLILAMVKRGENVAPILTDKYYRQIIKFDGMVSLSIKLCHRLSFCTRLETVAYKLLSLVY